MTRIGELTGRSCQTKNGPATLPVMITTTWNDHITDHDAWLRAAGRPATTRELRAYQLRAAAGTLPDPGRVTADDLAAWLGDHVAWAPETRRSYRSALRGFFRWTAATGRTTTNPAEELPPIRAPRHYARPIPDDRWKFALVGADPRLRVMITLGARLGLRRGEISRVRGADLVVDLGGWSLRVAGKGGRVRMVPLPDDVAGIMRHYADTVAGSGWFFPSPRRAGPLTPAHVGKLIAAALGEGWTAHTLRHRFATRTYAGSRDLLVVQQLLGHAKPETTQGYVEVAGDALREAVRAAA